MDDDDEPQKPKSGSYAQIALDGAKNRLNTAQNAMLESSKNYIDSTKLVTETQSALDAVKSRLSKLNKAVLTLVRSCIPTSLPVTDN